MAARLNSSGSLAGAGVAARGIEKSAQRSGETLVDWPKAALGGFAKRLFDIVIASLAVFFLSPLLLVLAVLVHRQDGGPAVYAQTRIGLGGRTFQCFKFRSMVVDSDARLAEHLAKCPSAAREWSLNRKLRDDPRVTLIGKLLRKTSLDELPQLFNVLRGEMSLVGPRPVVAAELKEYGLSRVHYLRARPGLTGLWQVSGRSHTSYKRRIELDRTYVNRWSLVGDARILLRTVPVLLLRSGAM